MAWKLWPAILLLAAWSLPASGPDAPVADAAARQDAAAVRELIETGADVNEAQVDGMTALHWAAYHEDLATAKLLIESGAKAAPENRYGVTPLSEAAENGDAGMVKLLLAAGADPNTTLPGGETALMTAARTGESETVKALLLAGADVQRREKQRGQTAIMWAAAEGHADVLSTLMEYGADFRERLLSGFTPFLFAVREGRSEAVETLLGAGVDVNQVIEPGEKTPRKSPREGMSALLLAVMNAHWELAGMLLDAGADPNADLPGFTPLHAVAVVRNPGIGDNDPPPEGLGEMSSLEFVGKIVAAGGEINARMTKNINIGNTRLNRLGATPLFLAAHTADLELMKTLVELGADPSIPNSENTTALMAAAGLGTRSPGEDAGTEEEVVAALGYLLELGLDINAVDDHRETAMHGAAYKNAPAAVDFLAAQGADISVWNRKNEYGWTPLTIAEGYRFGNFKPSLVTVEAIRRSMLAAGVVPPEGSSGAKSQQIY